MLPQPNDFAAAKSRVRIGRLNLDARIPYSQAVQSGPASDPSRAFAEDFGAALGDMLAPVCDVGDPSVWIIRRLDFDLAGGHVWEPGRVAGALAEHMRHVLLRVFAGETSDLAIRFPSRAAYLAQFLSCLADGTASDRWYFAALGHLGGIPAGIAGCMALEAEPDHAFDALIAMNRQGSLPRFLACLSDREAARILQLFGDEKRAEPLPEAMIAVCEFLLKQAPALRIPVRGKAELELVVGIAAATKLPPEIVRAALAAVISRIRMASEREREATTGSDLAPPEEGRRDSPAFETSGEKRLGQLMAQLAGRADQDSSRIKKSRAAVEGIVTPRAGVFLLWRSVMDLGLDAIFTRGCGAAEAKARRHQLANALSGTAKADAAGDEALRWMTGYEEEVEGPGSVTVEDAALLQQSLFRTLTGLRPMRALRLAVCRENGITILRDMLTQDWYFIRGDGEIPALPDCDITSIFVPADIATELCDRWPGWEPVSLSGETRLLVRRNTGSDTGLLAEAARVAADLRPTGPDLAYLSGVNGCSGGGLTTMLFARAAYADIGRRLPGLTLSSAAYLGRNAIHGVGRLRENSPGNEADADVDLPSVPFDFIWRMTGMDGTVYRLADGRSVRLNMARAGS